MAQEQHNARDSSTRLLERGELAEQGPPEAVRLPLDLVDENSANPRKVLAEIEELSESIRTFGLLQPVTVRRAGERYELLGGHRRRAAVLLLADREPFDPQWRSIAAVIRSFDDDAAYLALLAGQLHSKSWHPREEAAALELLASTRTLDEVGLLVHHGASWVSKRLRVYSDAILSGPVQMGQLAPTIAHELLLAKDPVARRTLTERAIAEDWSRDRARAEVRKLKASRMIAEIGRQANALLEALAIVQPAQLPPETTAVLWKIRGRIVALGRGGPVLPSIASAEKAAGVNPDRPVRATRERRKPGYKPRT